MPVQFLYHNFKTLTYPRKEEGLNTNKVLLHKNVVTRLITMQEPSATTTSWPRWNAGQLFLLGSLLPWLISEMKIYTMCRHRNKRDPRDPWLRELKNCRKLPQKSIKSTKFRSHVQDLLWTKKSLSLVHPLLCSLLQILFPLVGLFH